MSDLRALTIRQPGASLIAAGVQTIHTDKRRTSYRGPVLIHAGKHEPKVWAYEDGCNYGEIFGPHAGEVLVQYALHLASNTWHMYVGPDFDRHPLPLGAVVAVADLTDCVPIYGIDDELPVEWQRHVAPSASGQLRIWHGSNDHAPCPSTTWSVTDIDDQLPLGDFTPGRWAWLLDNVRPLAVPVPAKGRPGLWHPDADLVAAVEEVTR